MLLEQRRLPLTDSSTNNVDTAQTLASENYVASGTLETVQETIVSVRNARVEVVAEREQINRREFTGTDTTTEVTNVEVQVRQTGERFIPPPPPPRRRRRRRRRRRGWDPIAQSFMVFGDTGVFLTSVDIYFSDMILMIFLLFSNLERWKMEYQLRRFYLSLK